jgi:hypothetical protein
LFSSAKVVLLAIDTVVTRFLVHWFFGVAL